MLHLHKTPSYVILYKNSSNYLFLYALCISIFCSNYIILKILDLFLIIIFDIFFHGGESATNKSIAPKLWVINKYLNWKYQIWPIIWVTCNFPLYNILAFSHAQWETWVKLFISFLILFSGLKPYIIFQSWNLWTLTD